jgi:hypothetical protein
MGGAPEERTNTISMAATPEVRTSSIKHPT